MLPLRAHARALHYRPPPPKKAVSKPSTIFRHKLNAELNTAFIRVGGNVDFLRSPAEAFALIRDVERRFGPIHEFHFQRDSDQNTRYQSFVFAAFKDPASYQRLPPESMEFAFRRPSVNFERSGGIGLEDLKPFLEPQPLSDSEVPVPDKNTVPYTIKQSPNNLLSQSMYTKVTDVSSKTAQLFLGWGGFHSLKPVSTETDLQIENVFGPTSTDNYRMRCALRRYSEMISAPNPYEVVPGQEIETTLQEQEVSLPDLESTARDSSLSDDEQVQTKTPDVTTSKDTPTVHPPSSTPSTPTPSTLQQPDTTSLSTLESSPPAARPKTSAQEPIATSASASPTASPSPASPPPPPSPASDSDFLASPTSSSSSTAAEPPTTWVESVAEAVAIASKMQNQAKSMNRAKIKKEEKKKIKRANPLPELSKKKSAQPSAKAVKKGAQQTTKTKQKVVEEKPKTVREKIAGFFSSFF